MPVADPTVDLRNQASALESRAAADEATLAPQEAALAKERQAHAAQLQQARGSAVKDYDAASTDLQKTAGQGPEQVAMPKPDLGPPLDPGVFKNFMYGMLTLAAIGAVGGRQHYEGAIEALAGSLQGFREGNMDLARERKEQFDREFKEAQTKQAEADKAYERILNDKKLTLNMKAERIRIASTGYEDWAMNAAAVQHDYDAMHRRIDQNNNRAMQMRTLSAKLDESRMLKEMAAQAKTAQQDTGKLDDDTLHFMAAQYVDTGDRTVFQNLGRGAQGSANITRLRGLITEYAKQKGLAPAEVSAKVAEFEGLKASERTAGTRIANVEMAVNEADNMAGIVLQTSRAFPRTEYQPVNKALKAWKDNTGSAESRQFGAAVNSFINAYARAVSPTGTPTVSDKEHARDVLSAADSQEQLEGLMSTLKLEMGAAMRSPGQVKEALRRSATGQASPSAPGSVNWNDLPSDPEIPR